MTNPDWTYDNGWTLQSMLDAMSTTNAAGEKIWVDPASGMTSSTTDPMVAMGYQQDYYGGQSLADRATSLFGIQDPMNNLGAAVPDIRNSSGDEGELFDKAVMALVGAGVGAGVGSWAGGLGAAGGLADAGMGVPELGMVANVESSLPALAGGITAGELGGGAGALTLEGLGAGGAFDQFGSLGTPMVEGVGGPGYMPVDLQSYLDATGSSLSSALTGVPSSGLPSLPPGTSTIAQQLAKALGGGLSSVLGGASGGLSGYLQSGSPGSQGYVRKSRPPLTQPAFLGDQGQQPLGSAEDTAFNEMVAGRGEDTSTRARQMAAQLRGKPGFFGFRSG